MRELLRRVWYLLRHRRLDADLAEEIEFHRAIAARELAHGETLQAGAALAVRRRLGNVALARDQARDVSCLAVLTAAGARLGALSGAWAARFVSTLLFDVAPRDPATLLMSASVMVAVATLPGWLPARRAMRMAPSTILRAD